MVLEIFFFFVLLVCECLNSDCMVCFLFFCLLIPWCFLTCPGVSRCDLSPAPYCRLVHSSWYRQRISFKCPQTNSGNVVEIVNVFNGKYTVHCILYVCIFQEGVLWTLNGCGRNGRWSTNMGCEIFFFFSLTWYFKKNLITIYSCEYWSKWIAYKNCVCACSCALKHFGNKLGRKVQNVTGMLNFIIKIKYSLNK